MRKFFMALVLSVACGGIVVSSCAPLTPEAQAKVDALDKAAATMRAQLETSVADYKLLKAEYDKLTADHLAGKPVDLARIVALVPALSAAAKNIEGVVASGQDLWKQREAAVASGAPWYRAIPWLEIAAGLSTILLGQNILQRRAITGMVAAVETSGTPDTKAAVETNTYGAGLLGQLTGGYLDLIVQGQTKPKG